MMTGLVRQLEVNDKVYLALHAMVEVNFDAGGGREREKFRAG